MHREPWFDRLARAVARGSLSRRALLGQLAAGLALAALPSGWARNASAQVTSPPVFRRASVAEHLRLQRAARRSATTQVLRRDKLAQGFKRKRKTRAFVAEDGAQKVLMLRRTYVKREAQGANAAAALKKAGKKQIVQEYYVAVGAARTGLETSFDRSEDAGRLANRVRYVAEQSKIIETVVAPPRELLPICEELCFATDSGNISKVPCQEAALLIVALRTVANPALLLPNLIGGNFADSPVCTTLDSACNTALCLADPSGDCLPNADGSPRLDCGSGCCPGVYGWACCYNQGFGGCCPFPNTYCDSGLGGSVACRLILS